MLEREVAPFRRGQLFRRRLRNAPAGVGPLVATAMVAAVGNAREFKSGRELSAWLGLVPRQHSSGNRNVLLGISKRGDRYLRTLLIHGARSALCRVERRRDSAASGRTDSSSRADSMWRRWRWRTRTRASSGRCSRAAITIGQQSRPTWATRQLDQTLLSEEHVSPWLRRSSCR